MDLRSHESLKALVLVHQYFELLELTGIEDNGDTLRLGHVEVDKDYPRFRAFATGASSGLVETSTFRMMDFDVSSVGRRGHAVIFRRFERPGSTEEYLAGWVKPERKSDAEKWVRRMNEHIAKMLKLKQP